MNRDLEKTIYSPTTEEINQITTFSKTSGISESVLLSYFVNYNIRYKSLYGTTKQVTSSADVAVACYYQDRTKRYSCIDLIAKVRVLAFSNVGFSEAFQRWGTVAQSNSSCKSHAGASLIKRLCVLDFPRHHSASLAIRSSEPQHDDLALQRNSDSDPVVVLAVRRGADHQGAAAIASILAAFA